MLTNRLRMIPQLILGAALALGATACGDDNDGAVAERAARATITFAKYYDSTGTPRQTKWSSTDKAVLCLADGSAKATASPIRPDQFSSLFIFNIKAPATATAVSYYPLEADVKVAGGTVTVNVPSSQNTSVTPIFVGHDTAPMSSYEGYNIELRNFPATLMVNVKRGNYAIKSIDVCANGGENIAGTVTVDAATWVATATEPTVHVELPTSIDCTLKDASIPVLLAPVTLSQGYTATVTTTDGKTMTMRSHAAMPLTSGELYSSDDATDSEAPSILFCGTNMVYQVDVAKALGGEYTKGIMWSWDAKTAATTLSLAASRCDHIDDCKPVDNGRKLLITSSYNWCVLLDRESKNILFNTTSVGNAHSAELLPNNRVVVACSDGSTADHDQLQLYDVARSRQVIGRYTLPSAHGVVWCPTTQRLYAIGGQTLNVYSLQDWESANPTLKLEKSITTPKASTHDLTAADATTLVVAGNRAYLFDVNKETFTEMPRFSGSVALKSVNYNPTNGHVWYTDATQPEGTQSWSTQTLRYGTDISTGNLAGTIKVPGMDVYKVRVLNW